MLKNCVYAALSLMIAASAEAGILDGSGGGLDRYVGGNANGHFDIIGNSNHFGISSSTGSTSASNITVTIAGTYFDNPGKLGADLGDLFLDFNNYNPNLATSHTDSDGDTTSLTQAQIDDGWFGVADNMYSTPGTQWRYAVELLDANGESADDAARRMLNISQDVRLWRIDTTDYANAVKESDDYFGTGDGHRNQQEVRVNTAWNGVGQNSIIGGITGSWINDGSALTISINGDIASAFVDALGNPANPGTFAYHWAMECGNDVVEDGFTYGDGFTQVPEPSTAAIFGLGALGVVFAGRRRKNNIA